MPYSDLIDSLIGTYRELNLKLRTVTEERLAANGNGGSARDVVSAMRNRELIASQQLKLMMLADYANTAADVVDPASLDPVDQQTTRTLLSEFGTARESILAVVREMPDEALDRELPSPDGPMSIATFLKRLNDQDAQDRRKIDQILA